MAVNEDALERIHKELSKKYSNLGDLNNFTETLMNSEEARRSVHQAMSELYDMGDYDNFVQQMGLVSTETPQEQMGGVDAATGVRNDSTALVGGYQPQQAQATTEQPQKPQKKTTYVETSSKNNPGWYEQAMMETPIGYGMTQNDLQDQTLVPLSREESRRTAKERREISANIRTEQEIQRAAATKNVVDAMKRTYDYKTQMAQQGNEVSMEKAREEREAEVNAQRMREAAANYAYDYVVKPQMQKNELERNGYWSEDKIARQAGSTSMQIMKNALTDEAAAIYARTAYGADFGKLSLDQRDNIRKELEGQMAGQMVDELKRLKAPQSNIDYWMRVARQSMSLDKLDGFLVNVLGDDYAKMARQVNTEVVANYGNRLKDKWYGGILTGSAQGAGMFLDMMMLSKFLNFGPVSWMNDIAAGGLAKYSAAWAPGSRGMAQAVVDKVVNNAWTNGIIRGSAALASQYMTFGRLDAMNKGFEILNDPDLVNRYGKLNTVGGWLNEMGSDASKIINAYKEGGKTGAQMFTFGHLAGIAPGFAGKALGFGTEVGLFTYNGAQKTIDEYNEKHPEDQISIWDYDNWTEDALTNIGMVGAMKLMGTGQALAGADLRTRSQRMTDYANSTNELMKKIGMEFDRDDFYALERAGLGKMKAFDFNMMQKLMESGNYERLLKSNELPLTTLFKLRMAMEHRMGVAGYTADDQGNVVATMNPYDLVKQAVWSSGEHGRFNVTAYGMNDEVVMQKSFSTPDEAKKYAAAMNAKGADNGRRMMEMLVGDNMHIVKDAIHEWADENGVGRLDAEEVYSDWLAERENAMPLAKEVSEQIRNKIWAKMSENRQAIIAEIHEDIRQKTGVDLNGVLQKPANMLTQEEREAFDQYTKSLEERKKDDTTDPAVRIVEKTMDPKSGTVKYGTDGTGREVTVKEGESDAVILADPNTGETLGMVDKNEVIITNEVPAEQVVETNKAVMAEAERQNAPVEEKPAETAEEELPNGALAEEGTPIKYYDENNDLVEGTYIGPDHMQNWKHVIKDKNGKVVSRRLDEDEIVLPEAKVENSAANTAAPVAEASAEPINETGTDATGMKVDANGMPTMENDPKAVAETYTNGTAGMAYDEAKQVVDWMINDRLSQYQKLQKKQPEFKGNMIKYQQEKAAWQQQIDQIKTEGEWWRGVQNEMQRLNMEKEQQKRIEAQQQAAAAEAERQAAIEAQREADRQATMERERAHREFMEALEEKKRKQEELEAQQAAEEMMGDQLAEQAVLEEKSRRNRMRIGQRLAEVGQLTDLTQPSDEAMAAQVAYLSPDFKVTPESLRLELGSNFGKFGREGLLRLADNNGRTISEIADSIVQAAGYDANGQWRLDANKVREELVKCIQEGSAEAIEALEKRVGIGTQRPEDRPEYWTPEKIAEYEARQQQQQPMTEVQQQIATASEEVNTAPTDAQKEAGNYKKGHVKLDGMEISIEQPKGSTRSGIDAEGMPWSVKMNNTYGYIRGTIGKDKDHIDIFLSDNPEEGNVFVVDQIDPLTGEFDEHKVMYGFNSLAEAREAYLSNYMSDWQGLGNITEVNKTAFKVWLSESVRKTKPFADYRLVKAEQAKMGLERGYDESRDPFAADHTNEFLNGNEGLETLDEAPFSRGNEPYTENVTPEQKMATNTLMTALKDKAGIDVVMESQEEGQRKAKNAEMMALSNNEQEFDSMKKMAHEETGHVLPGLADKTVTIVPLNEHGFGGTFSEAVKNAKEWAKKNIAGKKYDFPEGGKYVISNKAIGKYLSSSAFTKSENNNVHLSALRKLPEIIGNSMDAEIHEDYKKGEDGKRNVNNGVDNEHKLVHRLYGAVTIDNKTYRVKTTMYEYRAGETKNNTPHSYEITEIELLDSPVLPAEAVKNTIGIPNNSISGANLLKNVEKSYDKGVKILDIQQNVSESMQNWHEKAADSDKFITPSGTVYGWVKDGKIHLTPEGINPNTPIHEYSHLWAESVKKNAPKLWENVKELMKGTDIWKEVLGDELYESIHGDEDRMASEVLSRLSGRRGAEKLTEMAKNWMAEHREASIDEKAAHLSIIARMKQAIKDVWNWVGKELFGIERFGSAEEVADRTLYDLMNGTDLNSKEVRDESTIENNDNVLRNTKRPTQRYDEDTVELTDKNYVEAIYDMGTYYRNYINNALDSLRNDIQYNKDGVKVNDNRNRVFGQFETTHIGQNDIVGYRGVSRNGNHIDPVYGRDLYKAQWENLEEPMQEYKEFFDRMAEKATLPWMKQDLLSKARGVENRMYVMKQLAEGVEPTSLQFGRWAASDYGRNEGEVRYRDYEGEDLTRTDNFKQWFGDWENDPENASKVVDAEGKPMVVYHGTQLMSMYFKDGRPYVDYTERFNTFKDGKGFFTSDRNAAESFARGKQGFYEVYLDMKKPFVIDCKGKDWDAIEGYENPDGYTRVTTDYIVNDIKRNHPEYDGVIFKNVMNENSGVVEYPIDDYVPFKAEQIKSAVDNNGDFSRENKDIRYRDYEGNDVFYSNAQKAVEGIKQEKATAEQWLKMIQNGGGLKAGEDKWLGLSDWLKDKQAKGEKVTKQEILDYINRNKIEIEEVNYSEDAKDNEDYWKEQVSESDEFSALIDELMEYDENDNPYINRDEFNRKANDPVFREAFSIDYWGEGIDIDDPLAAAQYLKLNGNEKPIDDVRKNYTTEGLTNKKEIALTVPGIKPYNESDEIHFGDAGEGRAVAWVRFGDATSVSKQYAEADKAVNDYLSQMRDKYGVKEGDETDVMTEAEITHLQSLTAKLFEGKDTDRVLVIDEIQSKRHQDGREKGYTPFSRQELEEVRKEAYDALYGYLDELRDKYNLSRWDSPYNRATDEERAKLAELHDKYDQAQKDLTEAVPDAPFEKNWSELAMKRMLRYAAENGYDKVAWTTGAQQAKRYDISGVVERVNVMTDKHPAAGDEAAVKEVQFDMNGNDYRLKVNREGRIVSDVIIGNSQMRGKMLSELFGKEVAAEIMDKPGGYSKVELGGREIGGEGMKGFYDTMLPSFMNKYGKKWGVKVGQVELEGVEDDARTMWSVDVTPEMKESVMHGQPMFRRTYHGSAADFEEFDHKFMGSGEGSRVYGWGTYVSEVEGIAKSYADIATGKKQKSQEPIVYWKGHKIDFSDANPMRMAFDLVEDSRTIAEARQRAERYEGMAEEPEMQQKWQAALDILKQSTKTDFKRASVKGNRKLYDVEIPDDNGKNYLDWNGPVPTDLKNKVAKEVIDRLIGDPESGYSEKDRKELMFDYGFGSDFGDGGQFYGTIQDALGSDKAASELLSKMGIVGVKVPTNNHHNGDKSRNNYVIFNENDAKIVGKELFRDYDENSGTEVWNIGEKSVTLPSLFEDKTESAKEIFDRQRETMPKTAAWRENMTEVVNHTNATGLMGLPGSEKRKLHAAAKAGDMDAAFELIARSAKHEVAKKLWREHPWAEVVYPHAEEASGKNKLPGAYAAYLNLFGFKINRSIVQTDKPHHTGANRMSRLVSRARYDGKVEPGKEYILVDDVYTMGGTLRDLKDYIESKGGKVVAISTLGFGRQGKRLGISEETKNELIKKGIKDEQLKEIGLADSIDGLTELEAKEIILLANSGRDRRAEERFGGDVPEGRGVLQEVLRGEGNQSERLNEVVSAAEETASKLNKKVHVCKSTEEIGDQSVRASIEKAEKEGRTPTQKGWFNTRTGEIEVYAPRAESAEDMQKTVLHETVGHYGLRELLSDNEHDYNNAMVEMYRLLNNEQKLDVLKLIANRKYDVATAMDEYLAKMAEDRGNMVEPTFWQKAKSVVKNLLRKLGIDVELSDGDLKYMLWSSHEALKNSREVVNADGSKSRVYDRKSIDQKAADWAMRWHNDVLGLRSKWETERNVKKSDVRDRDTDPDDDPTTPGGGGSPSPTGGRERNLEEMIEYDAQEFNREFDRMKSEQDQIVLGARVREFIRNRMTPLAGKRMTMSDINGLLRDVDYAITHKSKKGLERALDRMQSLIHQAEGLAQIEEMMKTLNTRTTTQDKRGMVKGVLVDETANEVLKNIKSSYQQMLSTSYDDRMSEVRREMRALKEQYGITRQDDPTAPEEFRTKMQELKYKMSQLKDERDNVLTSQVNETVENLKQLEDNIDNEINNLSVDEDGNAIKPDPEKIEAQIQLKMALPIRRQLAELRQMMSTKQDIQKELNQTGSPKERQRLEREMDMMQRRINITSREITDELKDIIGEGRGRRAEQVKADIDRQMRIVRMGCNAVRDAEVKDTLDKKNNDTTWKKFLTGAASVRDMWQSPIFSFNFMAKYIDHNNAQGDGDFYTYFMKGENGALKANNVMSQGIREFGETVDSKCKEIFGKGIDKVKADADKVTDRKIFKLRPEKGLPEEEWQEDSKRMTKGQMLYAWMTWRQEAGRTKMQADGWTKRSIAEMEEQLGPEMLELGRWITDDFLKSLRDDKYNVTYEKVMGTSMHKANHYFPLRIDKLSIQDKSEVGQDGTINLLPSASSGNLIVRTTNRLPVDLSNDAFEVLEDYGRTMERWNAMAELTKDLNTLIKSQGFRNLMEANHEGLFDRWKDACAVATASYNTKATDTDKFLSKLHNGFMQQAIGYGWYTALKQTLSAPAFWAYSWDPRYWKNMVWEGNVLRSYQNYQWAKENLPSFAERIAANDFGIEAINDKTFADYVTRKFKQGGMAANKMVDALTVANGARAVYEYDSNRFKNMLNEDGSRKYTDEQAEELAKVNAQIVFNESQQSSRNEFSAPIQKQRGIMQRSLVAFQNSNIGYRRMLVEGMEDLIRKNGDKKRGFAKVATVGILNAAWYMGLNPALTWNKITGKTDDEEDEKFWDDMMISVVLGYAANGTLLGPAMTAWTSEHPEYSPIQVFDAMKTVWKDAKKYYQKDDMGAMSWAIIDYILKAGGVNLEKFDGMYNGLYNAIARGEVKADDILSILNMARTQRRELANHDLGDKTATEYMVDVMRADKKIEAGDRGRGWWNGDAYNKIVTPEKRKEIINDYVKKSVPDFEPMKQKLDDTKKLVDAKSKEIGATVPKAKDGEAEARKALIQNKAIDEVLKDDAEMLKAYKRYVNGKAGQTVKNGKTVTETYAEKHKRLTNALNKAVKALEGGVGTYNAVDNAAMELIWLEYDILNALNK